MVKRKSVIAAIGNFDGVHLGHQALLRETVRIAGEQDAAPGAIVFEPHPRRFFSPDAPPFLLYASEMRDKFLKDHGAEEILKIVFDASLSKLSPSNFVYDVLIDRLGVSGLVAGADFRFGAKRAGDRAYLEKVGEDLGFHVEIVDLLKEGSEKFGSSAVREAIKQGDMASAASMLGRSWSVSGRIAEGQKLGRTLGFPTANVTLGEIIEPRHGVYATRARVDGKEFAAVSNFGRRPTVGADAPLLETHLLDFDGDLYGKTLEIVFVEFIRDEQKFDGLDALKAQIAKDRDQASKILG